LTKEQVFDICSSQSLFEIVGAASPKFPDPLTP
jgi:hypothetical protein